jgi:hypothetical protein
MSVPTPASNLIRIVNRRAAIKAARLQAFALEQKLRSFEEWRRDALAAIRELEEQMPSSHFPSQDSRQVSSSSEEFEDLIESSSSDDPPSQPAPKPKKPRSPQP